jgi:hypothetical protein
MTGLRARIREWIRCEDGTASVEFVLVVPPMFMVFIMAFESGVLMIRNIMLERGLDIVMQDLRMNRVPTPTVATVKKAICENALIFANCQANLVLNLEPVDMTTWNFPGERIKCIDRSATINPASIVSISDEPHQVMLVRACLTADALFPTTGLGLRLPKDGKGGYWLTSVSAFVNEPVT